jgi:hypothetical protein
MTKKNWNLVDNNSNRYITTIIIANLPGKWRVKDIIT